MSTAMRIKIGDLSVDTPAAGGVWGGRLLGRWRPAVTQTPANQLFLYTHISPLIYYSISLILHLFRLFSLTRLTYITTP